MPRMCSSSVGPTSKRSHCASHQPSTWISDNITQRYSPVSMSTLQDEKQRISPSLLRAIPPNRTTVSAACRVDIPCQMCGGYSSDSESRSSPNTSYIHNELLVITDRSLWIIQLGCRDAAHYCQGSSKCVLREVRALREPSCMSSRSQLLLDAKDCHVTRK